MSYTPSFLIDNKNKYPKEPALSVKVNGEWKTMNWSEYYSYVIEISKSLIALNLEVGEKGAIYSYNRKEWFGCYSAMQLLNCVSVAVYHTSSSSEVEWIVGNSDSKIVFVGHNPNDNDEEDKMPINRLLAILEKLDTVEVVVLMGADVKAQNNSKIINWEEFIKKGSDISDAQVEDRMKSIDANDTSSLIYTSGTTGNPKGVELTHNNFKVELDSVGHVLKFDQGDRYVSWLPLAHVFGQLVDNHYWVRRALHMSIVDSPLNTIDYAKEVQPHLFISVPRIYEKVYSILKQALKMKRILKMGLKIQVLY